MSAGKCKNFNGIQNDACRAGVTYTDVRKPNADQPGYSLPCLEKYNHAGATCEKRQMPTAEEVAAEEAERKAHMEKIGKARAAIVAHLGGPWKKGKPGASGAIDCPVCGAAGALRFSRAGYNGHIHAACYTPECVSWME